ncbi:MAG: hypothetical protein NZ990_05395 [Myxococcota bacterium]|nr:hypothetical protein [Myxococcota bacterium]
MGLPSSYELLDEQRPDSQDFEVPAPELDPARVLSPEQRSGPNFRVARIHYGPGFLYVYSIETDAGVLQAHGMGMLRKRIHEIETLESLEAAGVEDYDVYALALANAAEAPAEGGMQLLFNPVRTTTNIPKGIWSMAQNYYEMTGAGRTYLEDDYFRELIGFGRAKREWAYRLGVDPYSRNLQLQMVLDRLAWLSLAGGMTVRLPLIAVPGGASIALTVTNASDDMKRELRDEPPENIRIRSRKMLVVDFGVDESLAEEFVYHSWYSPSQLITILEALEAMGQAKNKGKFIALAVLADTPVEAHSFTRLALILLAWDQNLAAVEEFLALEGLALAKNEDNDVALPLNIDRGFWTEGAAGLIQSIDAELAQGDGHRRKLMLISGTLSPLARRNIEARDWIIVENLENSWLKDFDDQEFAPGEGDENRILPEIGG